MYNKVVLVGNLGNDPEIIATSAGNKIAKFSLATSETYKKDGEKVVDTTWHRVVAYRGAEVFEKYVTKGQKMIIEGKISNRSYQDGDGNTKYVSEVVCDSFQMLGGENSEKKEGVGLEDGGSGELEDEIPF